MRYRREFRLRARNAGMLEQELREELEAHLAMRVEELVARGESPERARALALERFGDPGEVLASARQRERELRRREWFDEVRRDLVLTWRRAARSPAAT
ncbi:MAG TPA: permease prefix domain 1-containing protein, partial [Longimicrobiales bacterium]|nr:permease prefix domain 1-containing protein [Longimicrobiales bacterium]